MNNQCLRVYLLKQCCIVCLTLLGTTVLAQSDDPVARGDRAFDERNYQLALEFYEDARSSSPGNPDLTRKLALTYARIGQVNFAAEWYKRTIELGSNDPLDMLRYAEVLKSLQQYDEAIVWFERFHKKRPNDKRGISHTADTEYYLDLFADTAQYSLKSLKINSSYPIISITPFTGNTMILSGINVANAITEKDPKEFTQYLDLYNVQWSAGDELTNPISLNSPANSPWHDGPAFFSKADNTLYITRNNDKIASANTSSEVEDFQLIVVASKWDAGKWSEPVPLKFNAPTFSCGHASLSPDGKTLFFASNKSGGAGGTDLYYCTREGDTWSEPRNMGADINTEGNEMFPVVDNAGNLYLASNGLAGLGGLDVFVTRFDNGIWIKPRNMGAPINSASDDFGLVYNTVENTGFFCSNRNGLGNDDLFYFSHKPISRTFVSAKLQPSVKGADLSGQQVRIVYVNSGSVETAKVSPRQSILFSAEPGEEVAVYMVDTVLFEADKPVVVFKVPHIITDPYVSLGGTPVKCNPSEQFKIVQESKSTSFEKAREAIDQNLKTAAISTRKPAQIAVDLEARNLSNVFFGYNESDLTRDEMRKLDQVNQIMEQNPKTRLIIRAFCDTRGSVEYNKKLSMERAEKVKAYMKSKGIPQDRLRIEWFGKDNPAAECGGKPCSENQHQMNRRAELNLVSIMN
jgi:outer membrane protein OmpA-like peptidoglycan-associated protein